MIFKNPAYFTADNWDIHNPFNGAIFTNNGVMTFWSNGLFGQLTNFGTLNLNANDDMDFVDDSDYSGFAGYILNKGIVNANGMIRFQRGIDNIGVFIVKNYAEFEVAVYNYVENEYSGLFIINAPTTFKSFINNNRVGATFVIKGTTLTTMGGFWNYLGATLIFSTLNGQLGQLAGNLTNQDNTGNNQGKVKIIVTGLIAGQKYQIITGDAILDEKDIEFIGGTGRYENGWVWVDSIFSKPEFSLNPNQQIIKNTLENLGISSSKLNLAITDTEKTIQKSFITQPKLMIKTFQKDTLSTPLNSAYVSRLTASSRMIMNDSRKFINPLERMSQTQFFTTPFGGVLKGDDLSGHLLGLSVGLTHIDDDYIAQGHFAYANGTSTQDLQTQSTQINGNLFQVGGFGRLFYDKLETDINANFIFAKFSLDNTWLDNGLNSSSNFNNYQINLGAVAGWRFGDDLSVKPFASLQTYYENQGEFKQSALNLTSEAYSSFVMDALVGVEGRYIFENGGFVFAKASYENKLYNSHKEVFMRVGTEALRYENESYDNVASLNLGARVLATKALKLDLEGLYKHYDNGLDYLGANLSVRWSF